MAGLKDRRAVTRQWVSVPAAAETRLDHVGGDGIRLLGVSRHGNKLRAGHLRGNRFRIRIRAVDSTATTRLPPILNQIARHGLTNFYGEQRFGRDGETLELGLRLLRGDTPRKVTRFLRKLALSAVQSALFNHYLSQRLGDGLMHQVLLGDVMAKWPVGGLFRAEDLAVEQPRFDGRETVPAGPIFGRKMFPAAQIAAEREAQALKDAGLTKESFAGFGKLLQGTRRHNLVYLDHLRGQVEGNDAILEFALPAGSYATVLLREVMKTNFEPNP
jgi:tRNA pseudouridine13 synthase